MMGALDVVFNSDYLGNLLQLFPVSFLLGGFLVFSAWALGMGFAVFARVVRG